jgi:hypothetical protein
MNTVDKDLEEAAKDVEIVPAETVEDINETAED